MSQKDQAPAGPQEDPAKLPTLYFLDGGTGGNVTSLAAVGSSGRVLTSQANGSGLRTLVSGLPHPDGIDICPVTQRMYWTNMGAPASANNGSVMSAKLDGSDVQTVIPDGAVHTPKQIFVDARNGKLYFCDREGLRIHRCDLDGQRHEIIVQTGDWTKESETSDTLRWCVGITVDVEAGKLYWTQKGPSKGGKGRIFRANMDMPEGETASTRSDKELLFDKLPEPIDLEIVPKTQMLYWTDRGDFPLGNTLNSAAVGPTSSNNVPRTDGDVTILARHFHELIGLKIDKIVQHIYLTDLGGSVYLYDIKGKDKRVLMETENAFTGIGLAYCSCS